MSFPNPRPTPGSVLPGSIVGDFMYYDDFSESGVPSKWDTVAEAGTWLTTDIGGTSAHTISDDEPGGTWRCDSNSSTTNQGVSCQMNGTAFQVRENKDIYWEMRYKSVNSVTAIDWVIGLADITTAAVAATSMTDFMGFTSNAAGSAPDNGGTANIIARVGTAMSGSWTTSGVMTEADSGVDLVADTFVTVAFHVSSNKRVSFMVNGKQILVSTTNIPSSVALSPVVAILNNGSVQSIFEIDYIYCAQAR